MSELWEHCDTKSLAVLTQLYWNVHGCYPDFYYRMKEEWHPKPDIVIDISPDTEQQLVDETNRELAQNSDIKAKVE